jgi:hypothetical protein
MVLFGPTRSLEEVYDHQYENNSLLWNAASDRASYPSILSIHSDCRSAAKLDLPRSFRRLLAKRPIPFNFQIDTLVFDISNPSPFNECFGAVMNSDGQYHGMPQRKKAKLLTELALMADKVTSIAVCNYEGADLSIGKIVKGIKLYFPNLENLTLSEFNHSIAAAPVAVPPPVAPGHPTSAVLLQALLGQQAAVPPPPVLSEQQTLFNRFVTKWQRHCAGLPMPNVKFLDFEMRTGPWNSVS